MPKRIVLVFFAQFFSFIVLANPNQNYPFSVETKKENNGYRIVARNDGPVPVSVKVAITNSQNISTDRSFPVFAVVPPRGGTLYLARIRPAIRGHGFSFNTQHSWVLGDFNARQSPDAMYRLPYPDGSAYMIGQAYGGPITTHTTPESRYAVDIGMPQGTPVLAARDGIVIYTEAGQTAGGLTPNMLGKANEVRIQHIDGTIAVYAHLAHGGVFVHPGQQVTAGTQIGLTGSTGYSSGPHLHFAVQTVAQSGERLETISLPFQFYIGNPPTAFVPRRGLLATANYSSPARLPASSSSSRFASSTKSASPQATQDTEATAMSITFQIPPPILSWLMKVPLWQWIAGLFVIFFLLIFVDKARQSRQRRQSWVFREPVLHPRSRPAEDIPRHTLSYRDRLVIACGGDRQKADQLQKYECRHQPEINGDEAARRAWERLQYKRKLP
ncbi:MAG: M23 family metallopeptidase [Candidatus Accumulibacter sp.]|jgi:murein DD-endopeptidase MepM/ murein hydrolase activator NlpD|nr:M23 family metallopeptidase [Accumulibacter sp.]